MKKSHRLTINCRLPEKDIELAEMIKLLIRSRLGAYIKMTWNESEHPLLDYIKEEFGWVSKNMKLPTPEQCDALILKYKRSSIIGCLQSLENRRQIKNNKVVSLTIKNWLGDKTEHLRPIEQKQEVEDAKYTEMPESVREKMNEFHKKIKQL